MKFFIYLAFFTALLPIITHCSNDEEEVSTISKIQEDMIPQAYVDSLRPYVDINEGNTPPNIAIDFVANPFVMVYDSKIGNKYEVGEPRYFSIRKKNPESAYYSYYMTESNEISKGDSLIVIGSGNKFTAYFIDNVTFTSDSRSYKAAAIFSGEKVNGGIKNLKYAFIFLDKVDPDNTLMDIGQSRCYMDEDGFSVDSVWTSTTYSSNRTATTHKNGVVLKGCSTPLLYMLCKSQSLRLSHSFN